MKRVINFVFVLLFACGVSFCFAEEQKQPSTIVVKPGEEFTITLDSNSTTGYSWQFARPLDKSLLELIITAHSIDKPKLVGSGGKQMWTIKALKPGKTNIFFKYVRPWEKDKLPAKKTSFMIIIK